MNTPCPTCVAYLKPILEAQAARNQYQGSVQHVLNDVEGLIEGNRREELYGHSELYGQPLSLQAAKEGSNLRGADPSYPPSNYPTDSSPNRISPTNVQGADPNYPPSNYPVGPELNQIRPPGYPRPGIDPGPVDLEAEKARMKMFGYARGPNGEKTTYDELVRSYQQNLPASWTCPACGLKWNLHGEPFLHTEQQPAPSEYYENKTQLE